MRKYCQAAKCAVDPCVDKSSTRSGGFTMIELMIVIALAAIMLSLAVPNIYDAILNSRLAQATNEMTAAINVARSEAMTRGAETGLCASPGVADLNGNQAPTDSDCTAGIAGWETGWMVMIPDAATGNYIASRIYGGFNPEIQVGAGGTGLFAISFDRRGNLNSSSALQISICDDRGATDGKLITIGTNGRIETRKMGGAGPC